MDQVAPHVAREGRENKVPHLNAVRRDDVTGEVIVTKKLGEVM